MTVDEEIDALYQLSPGDFTAARNALAKRAGSRAAEVKGLVKPNAAAWAINRLFWERRETFDALASASEARRAVHVQRIGGRGVAVEAAEATHRAALEAAVTEALGFLSAAGEPASAPTAAAVRQTLEAVPSPDVAGRLTRPLEPAGFSMLASLMASAADTRMPAEVVSIGARGARAHVAPSAPKAPTAAESRRAAAAARREEAALARRRSALEAELARAQAAERAATKALEAGRQGVERADARVEALDQELRAARATASAARAAIDGLRAAVNDAAADRIGVERRLREV